MTTVLIIYLAIGSLYAHLMLTQIMKSPETSEEKVAVRYLQADWIFSFFIFGLLMFGWLPITLFVMTSSDEPTFN